jgi:hypothetical protein
MAPSSPPDDISPPDEDELREQVLEGLRLALNDEFAAGSTVDRRDLTKTEEEKLLYFAIRDFDLPLTYSWYLAGVKTDSDSGSSAQIGSLPSPESPSLTAPTDQTESVGESDVPSEVQKYRDYYKETEFFDGYTLKDVVYTEKTEFLCDFYRACTDGCADEYEDLYVHSTRLREKLEEITTLVEQSEQDITLSNWGGGSDDGLLSRNEEKKFRRLVSELQLELARIDEVEECRTPVREATDEIEIILTKLTHLSSLTDEQKEIVDGLDDFFYWYVWRYPALKISAETATGPKEEELAQRHESKFSVFHHNLGRRTQKLRDNRVKAGFTPSSEEFVENESEAVMVSVHEMSRDVLGDDE